MAYFLGIDVGGTASRWALIGADGALLTRGTAQGATGHIFNPAERRRFTGTMSQIAALIPQKIAAIHMGVTGLGKDAGIDARAIAAEAFGVVPGAVTSSDDIELAFRAAFAPGQGHLVSAGTGSMGVHITAAGEMLRVGGRGMLIDDGGSGTWIALTALDRLYRRVDETGGYGDAGELASRIAEMVGGSGWSEVRAFVYGSERGRIGTLATAVAAAATAGDALASQVIGDAADELVRLAQALIGRVQPLPVAFVGGVIDLHSAIRPRLEHGLAPLPVAFPRLDAALHAAQMATGALNAL